MNKQKQVIELLIYLVALIIGIVMLVNGYYKREADEKPKVTTEYCIDVRGPI